MTKDGFELVVKMRKSQRDVWIEAWAP